MQVHNVSENDYFLFVSIKPKNNKAYQGCVISVYRSYFLVWKEQATELFHHDCHVSGELIAIHAFTHSETTSLWFGYPMLLFLQSIGLSGEAHQIYLQLVKDQDVLNSTNCLNVLFRLHLWNMFISQSFSAWFHFQRLVVKYKFLVINVYFSISY